MYVCVDMVRPRLLRDQRGLTTVEYIIVLGLIAVFGIAMWRTFGQTLTREVGEADKQMDVVEPQ